MAHAVQAQPSMPWTPDWQQRHELSLLVDTTGLALTLAHWPQPAAAVAQALGDLPAELPPIARAARQRLLQAIEHDLRAETVLSLATPADRPVGFGSGPTPGSSLALRTAVRDGPHLAARLGLSLERAPDTGSGTASPRLEGSFVAVRAGNWQFQAVSQRHWWGPGWQDSLVLGHNAPTLNGLGVQRASLRPSPSPWLAWAGPWSFELFFAALEGVKTPAHPLLLGQRLSLRPWPGVEIGLSRTAQWGGAGRRESWDSLRDLMFGGNLNIDRPSERDRDAANVMAGLDLRLRCPAHWPCATYLQLIGEDEAGGLPSRYLGLYGAEAWSADGRYRGYVELSETACGMPILRSGEGGCAYRNHAYPEGYVQEGRWLGSGFGPDSRIVTVGAFDAGTGLQARLHAGHLGARLGRFVARSDEARDEGRLLGLQMGGRWSWRGVRVEPWLAWTRVRGAESRRQLWQLGLTFRRDER